MESFSEFEIHDNSVTNQVREQLRRRILGSKFEMGEKINIDRLSHEWKVSKTPVREALRSLEEERLVRYLPRKGYFVLALEFDEIKDIIELRMVLESYALQKGFDSIDRPKLGELFAEVERHYEAFKIDEENRYLQLDHQFHLEIVQSTGNQRLVDIYKSLKGTIDLIRLAQGEEVGGTMPEHHQMVEAILGGNLQEAKTQLQVIFEKIQRQFMATHRRK
jgi:DNA-binding GntR family transcriptional regulator